jgi:hypothetical protein
MKFRYFKAWLQKCDSLIKWEGSRDFLLNMQLGCSLVWTLCRTLLFSPGHLVVLAAGVGNSSPVHQMLSCHTIRLIQTLLSFFLAEIVQKGPDCWSIDLSHPFRFSNLPDVGWGGGGRGERVGLSLVFLKLYHCLYLACSSCVLWACLSRLHDWRGSTLSR